MPFTVMSLVPLRGPRWRSQEGGNLHPRWRSERKSFTEKPCPPRRFPAFLSLLSSSCPPRPSFLLCLVVLVLLFAHQFFSSSLPSFLLFLAFSLISLLPSPHVRPPRRLACLPSPLVSLPSPSSLSSSEVEIGIMLPSSQSPPSSLHHRRFCRSEQDRRSHLRGNGVC